MILADLFQDMCQRVYLIYSDFYASQCIMIMNIIITSFIMMDNFSKYHGVLNYVLNSVVSKHFLALYCIIC